MKRNRPRLTAASELEAEVSKLEEDLRNENIKYEQIISMKKKQVEQMTAMMSRKESEIKIGRERTQSTVSRLKKLADEVKGSVSFGLKEKAFGQTGDMARQFDEAVKLCNAGDHQQSCEILERIIKSNPGFAPAYQYIAIVYLAMGNEEGAKKAAETALEIEPQNDHLKQWIKNIFEEN